MSGRPRPQPSTRLLKHRVASLAFEHRPLNLSAAGEDAPDQHDPADRVPHANQGAEENTEAEDGVAEGHGTSVGGPPLTSDNVTPPFSLTEPNTDLQWQ